MLNRCWLHGKNMQLGCQHKSHKGHPHNILSYLHNTRPIQCHGHVSSSTTVSRQCPQSTVCRGHNTITIHPPALEALTRGRSWLETLDFLCRGFVILKPSFQYYVYCVFWWICMYLPWIRAWCVRGWVREAWSDVENVAGIKNKNSFSISLRL